MKVVTNNTLSYFWSKLKTLLGAKQDTLVSGTNIKTVNGQSLVGSGNVAIQIPPAPPEPLLVYMTESGGTYSLDKEVLDIEDALSDNDELECYLVWDGNNPAVVRLRCYGYNVEETIGGHSQSCVVWSGLDNIGNRHIVKAYHDSTNDVDVVNYSIASPDGKGITSIAKTATVGLVDTYTITYSDGTTSTYTVTNGRDGADGQDGADGADGVSLGEIALVQTTGDSTNSVMSQNAVTDAITVAGYTNKPTYLQGRLCYFPLSDYPDLDPRTADGISVVFTSNSNAHERTPMFDIWNPNNGKNYGMANKHFGLWNWDRNISFGFFRDYGNITTGGYSFSRVKGHYVITYDFKTGICKCYKNGVLVTTGSPTTWDEQTMVRDYFNTCTHIHLCSLDDSVGHKSTGIAVYSSVLTNEDVASIYGNGNESIKKILTPVTYQANHLHPILMNDWSIYMNSGTATSVTGGGYIVNVASSGSYVAFGFKGIEGLINNLIYEWDFEITSGSSTHNSSINYSRALRIGGNYYKCFVIYDSYGNDVTFDTLGVGTYHVVSKPNNVLAGGVNTELNVLYYYFLCSSDFSMTISPTLKLTERGAALECSIRTYRGIYWELPSGIKLPLNNSPIYATSDFILGTDTFIEDTVIYAANQPPQFNGQMAVDSANGKVYVGYLTGTGGTWKQINNS